MSPRPRGRPPKVKVEDAKIVGAGKAHAEFSCSGSERWMECAGSIKASRGLPDAPTSEFALEGQTAHTCVEEVFKSTTPRAMPTLLKKKYTEEMIQHAMELFYFVETIKEPDTIVLVEHRGDLTFLQDDMFGTTDIALVQPFGVLHIIDYKYGAGIPVEAKENTQLLLYALAVAHKYDYNFTEVKITIHQPRAPHEDGPFRSWMCSMDELMEWEKKFRKSIKLALSPKPPLKSGDWCRWCKAASVCTELSDANLKRAQIVFDDNAVEVTYPAAEGLTPERAAHLLPRLDLLEHWISAVRARAFEMLRTGHKIEGFKLVQKRATRKWIDAESASHEAKSEFGEQAFSHDLLSPAQLEKVVGKEWVAARAVAISSGVTLAPDSDRRAPVNHIDEIFN